MFCCEVLLPLLADGQGHSPREVLEDLVTRAQHVLDHLGELSQLGGRHS